VNPMPNFEDQIRRAKEKEAYTSFELYRLLRSAISHGLTYEDSRCEFKEVIPEFPIGEERADLIVFATRLGGPIQPFLVIEVKMRAYERPGPSLAKAVRRASSYATNLDMPLTAFFAVYDGWELMVFKNITPYLIGIYGAIKDEDQAKNLLLGLEEFFFKGKKDLLDTLPKHMDRDFLFKRIVPSIARELEKDISKAEALVESWNK